MPNALDSTGLTTMSLLELVANLTAIYQGIYGSDINVASNTPDGQLLNDFAQMITDQLDLLTSIYNSFDPDQAVGVTLDQRCAINGIIRAGGTYTLTDVTLTTDGTTFNLNGLDNAFPGLPLYTVADQAGNQYNLVTSFSTSATTTYVAEFQAAQVGAVLTVPNTIQVPVTIVLGVTSINNPSAYLNLGQNEETDAQLKIRRQLSVSLASQGFLSGLLAALLNIPGMESAFIYENTSDSVDGNGVNGHSIWVIVSGTAAASAIATAIYQKRNAGCGMKGSISYVITQADGTLFTVYWDTVVTQPLYIEFDLSSISGGTISGSQVTALKTSIVEMLIPGAHASVNINELATVVQEVNPDFLVTVAGLSTDGVTYTNVVTPSAKNKQFTLSTANIAITVV